MDKNQKSKDAHHKAETIAHSGKASEKHDTSSKKMMTDDTKSDNGMHASSSSKTAMGGKANKGK